MASDVITLPDGRRLRWHEFGDPDGSPVIYTAGTPVSGLGGASYDQTARAAGLRWISPDKPGYGGSDYQRKRSLTSWGDDLAALAGHLGLDRFALAGESGGGPYTLAAALRLGGRVRVAALIATGGPMDPAERAGQQARIRFYGWLAGNAPEARHAGLRIGFEAVADALRPGTRGTVQELALIERPWPFPLSEVKTPVHLWHGALDTNAPIAIARRLARELPDATLHVSDSSDHDIGHDRSDEITSVIASCVK